MENVCLFSIVFGQKSTDSIKFYEAMGLMRQKLPFIKDQVRVFRAMLFGYFPMKREDFTRVYNPNRGLRVSSIKT